MLTMSAARGAPPALPLPWLPVAITSNAQTTAVDLSLSHGSNKAAAHAAAYPETRLLVGAHPVLFTSGCLALWVFAREGSAGRQRRTPRMVSSGQFIKQRENVTSATKQRVSVPWRTALAFSLLACTCFMGASRAEAQPAPTSNKLHLGQRLALFLSSASGLPDWAILLLVSALPLVELRGGVPVGLWMGLSVPQVLLVCIVGNMLPIVPFLWALRLGPVERLFKPLLARASKKTTAISENDRWVGLAAFVGVPLPGTGAWTGAMVAYLLGMDFKSAVSCIFAGVCSAACIMASITLAGWYGCAIAVVLCAVALAGRYLPRAK